MKKQMLQLALLCILATCAVTRAVAQSRVTVKVPFDFSISDRTFPAGQYSILLRARLQSDERTLRDEEIAGFAGKIVGALQGLGGVQRA